MKINKTQANVYLKVNDVVIKMIAFMRLCVKVKKIHEEMKIEKIVLMKGVLEPLI